MVLIISEQKDDTTHKVIEWLHRWGIEYKRINLGDTLDHVYLGEDTTLLTINGEEIDLSRVKAYWYRKGGDWVYSKLNTLGNLSFEQQQHLFNEWAVLKEYLFYQLGHLQGISNAPGNLNKMIVLDKAKKQGLLTPSFFISDSKTALYEKTIIKAMGEGLNIAGEEAFFTMYTETIDQLPYDHFFATFFQEKIEAKYEIRSIFVKDCCWSMAIHNPDKEVDFRKNYPHLRYSPYQLPENVEQNTFRLMNELNLDYGAVDFIVDKNEKHYFLEINPVGQFGMVSVPCNYPIEKEIAALLRTHTVHQETY